MSTSFSVNLYGGDFTEKYNCGIIIHMVCFFNFFLSVRSGLSTFICFFGYQAKVVTIGQRVM